jgi:hypothetical protein
VAILYQAKLVPSKVELIASWLPGQSWVEGADVSEISTVGAFRFDDPDGEVGIETHLLKTADGLTLQVPLTYRAAPLASGSFLVGTLQHSVLGKRWVYDGCGDVTYLTAIVSTILNGGHEADLDVVTDDGLVRREATTNVTGSGIGANDVPILELISIENRGSQTNVFTEHFELMLHRMIGEDGTDDHEVSMKGTWPGQSKPVTLATLVTK